MKDWELHQARLHMHGNIKFLSCYKRQQEPVFEVYKSSHPWADLLITLVCLASVLLLGWGLAHLFSVQL